MVYIAMRKRPNVIDSSPSKVKKSDVGIGGESYDKHVCVYVCV